MSTPVPGEHHPAVADLAESLLSIHRSLSPPRDYIDVPVPVDARLADTGPMMTSMSWLTFTRERARQSFFPEYGYYTWDIWTDQYGRFITGEAEWIESWVASILPPVNPTIEEVWVWHCKNDYL